MPNSTPPHGLTPAELAHYWRVSPDFIRDEIRAGRLGAINTARQRCHRPRYVILPHHLTEWERAHRAEAAPPTPPRRKKGTYRVDYYPD